MTSQISPALSCSSSDPVTPPINLSPISKNYFDSLIETLNEETQLTVLSVINNLEFKNETIEKIRDLILTHDFVKHQELITNKFFEYYALAAVKEGFLSDIQYATLMFLQAALVEPNIAIESLDVIPLFYGDAPNENAYNFILETFHAPFEKKPLATREQLSKFFEAARNLPESEKHFVCFPQAVPLAKKNALKDSVFNGLYYLLGFNLFGLSYFGDISYRMVPSFGMIQAFFQATGNDGFGIVPRIGLLSSGNLRKTYERENGRVFSIYSPRIAPERNEITEFASTPFNDMYFQIYFAWQARCIPQKDRLFYCYLAKTLKSTLQWSGTMKQACRSIHNFILSMEFKCYRNIKEFAHATPERKREFSIHWIRECLVEHYSDNVANGEANLGVKMSYEALEELVYSVYGIWMVYKQNCTSFAEITTQLESMSCAQRKKFAAEIQKIHEYNLRIPDYPVISMETLVGTPLEKIAEFVPENNLKWWEIDLLRRRGYSFQSLWEMSPEKRKECVIKACASEYSLPINPSEEKLGPAYMDRDQLTLETHYEDVCVFIKAGVSLKKILEMSYDDFYLWKKHLDSKTAGLNFFQKACVIRKDIVFKPLYN